MFNGESSIADKFVVRMPAGMRERIAEIARDNHRSMNSEIIRRLEDSMAADDSNHHAIEHGHLSKDEKAIVLAVRNIKPSQRKALLALLAVGQ